MVYHLTLIGVLILGIYAQCPENCASCSGSSCTRCNTSYYLLNTSGILTCTNTCPQGQGPNTKLDPPSCVPCTLNCLSCINQICITCSPSYYLIGYNDSARCVYSCPNDFEPTGSCKPCEDDTYLNIATNGSAACVKGCYPGYWSRDNAKPPSCAPCGSHCLNCPNGVCDQCRYGKYLVDRKGEVTCEDNCPSNGFWLDVRENSTVCRECISGCDTCSNGVCSECRIGYYLDDEYSCIECDDHCAYCPGGVCSECRVGFYLDTSSGSPRCVESCPEGTWSDYSANPPACIPCTANCKSCPGGICETCTPDYTLIAFAGNFICTRTCPSGVSSNGICNSCDSISYIYIQPNGEPACTTSCPDGYWLNYNTSPTSCIACSPNCISCDIDGCITCKASYFLDTNSYPSNCTTCGPLCKECSDGTNCTQCEEDAILYNTGYGIGCILACPLGCHSCSDYNKCTECKNGYYLWNDENGVGCTEKCPSGYYGYNGKCSRSCPEGMYGIEDTGVCEKCPSGTFREGEDCVECPELCKECKSKNVCVACVKRATLNRSNECECDSGYVSYENYCDIKKVAYSVLYNSSDHTIHIDISATLSSPLDLKSISVKIDEISLNRDQYTLTQYSSGIKYTIQLPTTIQVNNSLRVSIIRPQNYLDSEGNPIDDTDHYIEITDSTSDEHDEENDSNEALIDIVCPILMSFCAVALFIGYFFYKHYSVWIGINFLQHVSYMYLIDLEWPDTISDFLPGILYYNYFPNIFHLIEKDGPSPFENAEDFSYDTSQFLRNNGVIITFFIAVLILWPFVILFTKVFRGDSNIITRSIRDLSTRYRWNPFIRVFIETYLVVSIVCLLQLKYVRYIQADYYNGNLVINFISALIAIVIYTQIIVSIVPILLTIKLYLNRNKLGEEKFIIIWGGLYEDLIYDKHPHMIYFYPAVLLRKFLLAINLVAIHKSPVAQLIINLILSYTVRFIQGLIYAVVFRPYKLVFINSINIISESVMAIVSTMIFGFINDENDGLQWTIIIIIIVGFLGNILLLLYKAAFTIRRKEDSGKSTFKVSCIPEEIVSNKISEEIENRETQRFLPDHILNSPHISETSGQENSPEMKHSDE